MASNPELEGYFAELAELAEFDGGGPTFEEWSGPLLPVERLCTGEEEGEAAEFAKCMREFNRTPVGSSQETREVMEVHKRQREAFEDSPYDPKLEPHLECHLKAHMTRQLLQELDVLLKLMGESPCPKHRAALVHSARVYISTFETTQL